MGSKARKQGWAAWDVGLQSGPEKVSAKAKGGSALQDPSELSRMGPRFCLLDEAIFFQTAIPGEGCSEQP